MKFKKPNAFNMYREYLKKTLNRFVSYDETKEKWELLTDDEKEPFYDKAKQSKKISGRNLMDNPLTEYEKKRREIHLMEFEKTTAVEQAVEEAMNLGELDDKIFYIISIETFYEDPHDIFPCELALAKFSLRKGIFDSLHIRINPGPLPLGTAYTAMEKSKKHKYPLPKAEHNNAEEGEKSYILILQKIISFIHPLDELPMFYAEGNKIRDAYDMLYNTQRALQKIFIEACEYQIGHNLKVYSISDLFYNLRAYYEKSNNIPATLQNTEDAHAKLTRLCELNIYNIESCSFHHEMDSTETCCLSKVRRFCYIIANFCADKKKYDLIKGQHYPKNYIVNE